MAMEAYTSKYPDKIHTDLLSDARQTCYKARDAFYACLEKESHIKANEIAAVGLLYPVQCKKTREFYEKVCRRTWDYPDAESEIEKETIKSKGEDLNIVV
ncbi:putative cytochrome c oxidase, subunit VIb [Helianthus annuus]|uniref:uncharacterized protein LOC110886664 isoform X2 n=1 Tax=Helianthus annuus TaxID=4232 RepID=UPI000B8F4696|nr:uncharacterized protein LOC110886664 isoform X2 [Helianthus annuus]KAJ0515249.1 putative cytochrome c oxidase, subunit VIb [Helianthus annuus]KAJ0531441.1 putative cytochrome c oxidase, subunit VIb [Helianthus annuus]KAJ0698284.1 putative cytochrome c oxidase, subunit VIb [Helianthus annuus]KAJ0701650.1 putative cytochrome c oxidase, subunit VIb [Helianthus annuus]